MVIDLDTIFTYHPPSPDRQVKYTALRLAAKVFAETIVQETPAGPDQSAATRKVREALITANAAIATER